MNSVGIRNNSVNNEGNLTSGTKSAFTDTLCRTAKRPLWRCDRTGDLEAKGHLGTREVGGITAKTNCSVHPKRQRMAFSTVSEALKQEGATTERGGHPQERTDTSTLRSTSPYESPEPTPVFPDPDIFNELQGWGIHFAADVNGVPNCWYLCGNGSFDPRCHIHNSGLTPTRGELVL